MKKLTDGRRMAIPHMALKIDEKRFNSKLQGM
jgi:hypothetical protein